MTRILMMMTIAELEKIIRDYVNAPRRHAQLISDEAIFNTLCSAMDCIGDAETALSAYGEMSNTDEVGKNYIVIYGVLQILYVQQDAIGALSKIFGIHQQRSSNVERVRSIRNYSVGHPTKTRDGAAHFISRFSLKIDRFKLMSRSPNGHVEITNVNLRNLVKEQRDSLSEVLRKVIRSLKEDEMSHRDRYRSQKLVELFPPSMSYFISKIQEATLPDGDKVRGEVHIKMIKEIVDAFSPSTCRSGA